jgi:hemolysin III
MGNCIVSTTENAPSGRQFHLPRPTFRGQIHRHSATAAIPLFAWLIIITGPWTQRLAVIVYALGVTTMLGVSAVYHSGTLSSKAEMRLKRVDHTSILFAIAGSYTAITALSLSGTAEVFLIAFVWIAAIIGTVIRLTWLEAPYFVNALVYVIVGWSALLVIPAFLSSLDAADTTLIFLGGAIYTVGAVIYALHRPNPWPNHFGYHEIFHVLVTVAAATHFLLVVRLVLATT